MPRKNEHGDSCQDKNESKDVSYHGKRDPKQGMRFRFYHRNSLVAQEIVGGQSHNRKRQSDDCDHEENQRKSANVSDHLFIISKDLYYGLNHTTYSLAKCAIIRQVPYVYTIQFSIPIASKADSFYLDDLH